jgi:hypothetical protein
MRIRKLIQRILYNLFIAANYFVASYYFIYRFVARENVLVATLLNLVVIVFSLLQEKYEWYVYKRLDLARKAEGDSWRAHLIRVNYYEGASTKAALYLFYFILILCSAVVAADPYFPYLGSLGNYFLTVSPGVLMLITADKLLQELTKKNPNLE